ncbi:hypothetical protein Ancab_006043 [Ancistrocladus abbreviatus]
MEGGHTIGFARCTPFRAHIYNNTNIDPSFANSLKKICPLSGNDNVLQGLDRQTNAVFDKDYYENLVVKKGLLHSGQELYNGNAADSLVKKYVKRQSLFFNNFAKSMIKMRDISPLTGSQGEIRLNCSVAN